MTQKKSAQQKKNTKVIINFTKKNLQTELTMNINHIINKFINFFKLINQFKKLCNKICSINSAIS